MIEQEITLLTNGRISFQKCGNGLQFGYSKNRGVYSIRVKTSGEWNGLTIRAFWHIPDIKEPITSLLVDNVIRVPALVTSYKGEGRIVFEGSDGAKTVTSADVRYYVNKNSGTCDGTIPEPGTPAWQELVGTVKKYSDTAVEAKESAKKSADEAKQALEDTKDVKSQAIEEINSSKTAVIEEIENKKNLSIEEINSVKEDAKGELETLCDSTRDFANQAKEAADRAKASELAAKDSEDKAKTSEIISTANTAEVAKNLETVRDIKSEIDILDANVSANAASSNENANNARISAEAAKQSETNVALSEASALESKNASAENAAKSQNNASNAKNSADSAKESETKAQEYSNLSQSNANASSESASNAKKSEVSAKASEDASKKNADDSAATLQELKDGIASGNFKGEKGDKGDPGPAVALDTTLTHEGEAADAKATGDAISAVKARQNILVGTETGNPIAVDDAFSAPLCGLTVYGRSTQAGAPTPDAPVPIVSAGDGGSVAVKVTGANVPEGTAPGGQVSQFGVTYTVNENGVSVTGTATSNSSFYLHRDKTTRLTHGTYYLTTKGLSASAILNFFYVGKITSDVQNQQVMLTKDVEYSLVLQLQEGVTANATVQVSLTRNKITAYSPYREQLLTLPTPTGLPGIPVTSGGNYTDPQGQQWICDEVDLERGVKVQRVNAVDLSTCVITGITNLAATKRLAIRLPLKGKDYTAKALCNRLPYLVSFTSDTIHFYVDTNNAQVFIPIGAKNPEEGEYILFYVLDTPIETPLTPDEIAAYKALTAYGPDTVVQSGDGAGVKLEYQRDVNLVVKKLEDAIASMT